jgi:uncharacterized damage-inducible protein DinB
MHQVDDIRRWYDYTRWANARVLDAAERLAPEALERDLGTSFASVRATLAHMLGAEWLWLERCRGRSPRAVPAMATWRTARDLRAAWAEVQRGQAELLAALGDDALGAEVAYTNLAGEARRYPLGDVLRHVVNHATYHRGQVTAMLRQLGAPGVGTDFILVLDEGAGAIVR